jgi:glyoxylase-like metal-dependent hydrolase (beta-lactamase superfamily II)
VVAVDGLTLRVLATPGHTADSVTFLDEAEGCLYTGDTVLGRGTTVVAHPDGRLVDYLRSLQRLAGLDARLIRPGHGPDVADVPGWIGYYREHRAARLEQIRQAVAEGARTPGQIVAQVYAEVDRQLWPAAELTVAAALDYLRERGQLPSAPGPGR